MPAALYPIPLPVLARRLADELASDGPVYGLPRAAIWRPDPRVSLATTHFGEPMATPLGPASGPHTQLAQNLALCWLGGARFLELKTVQIRDDLAIPRPCIYVPNAGYNVEWSQELRVAESLDEYIKGWILVHLAAARLGLPADAVFDMSLGYDLAGVQSETITGFVRGLQDAGARIASHLAALPQDLRIEVPPRVSGSVTLSTFHGCPAEQIEAIAAHCLGELGLNTIVKLNPTLLGYEAAAALLHDQLGYGHIALDPAAFSHDLQWSQLEAMVPRLRALASVRGLGFGVKFTNTLVCRAPGTPFGPGDVYLSGPPLHVLAGTLAGRFLAQFPDIPVSFSGGVDAGNFAEVVATGIGPVTTATDLLKGKGYGRLCTYLRDLEGRMAAAGVSRLSDFTTVAPAAWAARLPTDPRYHHRANHAAPRKVGTALHLLDCLTCDKCLPVCPNAALFSFDLPTGPLPQGRLVWGEGRSQIVASAPTAISRRHQIGVVADVCNACGQCDVVCPEDGGPFAAKTNLFYNSLAWTDHPERDGLRFEGEALLWRRGGLVLRWVIASETLQLPGGTARVTATGDIETSGAGEVDLADVALLRHLAVGLASAPWSPHAAAPAADPR